MEKNSGSERLLKEIGGKDVRKIIRSILIDVIFLLFSGREFFEFFHGIIPSICTEYNTIFLSILSLSSSKRYL